MTWPPSPEPAQGSFTWQLTPQRCRDLPSQAPSVKSLSLSWLYRSKTTENANTNQPAPCHATLHRTWLRQELSLGRQPSSQGGRSFGKAFCQQALPPTKTGPSSSALICLCLEESAAQKSPGNPKESPFTKGRQCHGQAKQRAKHSQVVTPSLKGMKHFFKSSPHPESPSHRFVT